MPLARYQAPWYRQPPENVRLNPAYGPALDIWLPTSSGLIEVGSQTGATFSTAQGGFGQGPAGREVRKNSANFVASLTITARPGATFESWLVVTGSTRNTQTTGYGGGATVGNAATSGLNINSDRIGLRAASSTIISDVRTPVSGEAVFFQNKNADHRLYYRGIKTVVAVGWGNQLAVSGLPQSGDSCALLARWTDTAPTDDQIWSLLGNPWLVFAPRSIWVPVSAGSDVSLALSGASAATAAGTTAASIAAALAGSAAGTAAGTVGATTGATDALTSASATAATGTLAASISTALAGVSSTTAAGTLAASISTALTGVSSTAATGTTAASDTVSLAGASATATAGTLSAGGDASAAVTGQAASTAQGTLGVTASGSAVLSGASVSTDAGTITATTGAVAALSGADAAVVTGTLAPTTSVVLTGAAAVVAAGDILVTVPTVGRPASDTSNSGWVPSTGSDLYAMLDEVAPDALDYIVATSIGALCELELDTTAYPGTASQTLKYRASSSTGNSVIVRLKNTGGATIRTETQALTSVDTEYSIALTAPEIAAITSGALSVQLESA